MEDTIAFRLLSSVLAVIVSGLLWNVWADISSTAPAGNDELWFNEYFLEKVKIPKVLPSLLAVHNIWVK